MWQCFHCECLAAPTMYVCPNRVLQVKLEGMFKDMDVSNDIMNAFRNRAQSAEEPKQEVCIICASYCNCSLCCRSNFLCVCSQRGLGQTILKWRYNLTAADVWCIEVLVAGLLASTAASSA